MSIPAPRSKGNCNSALDSRHHQDGTYSVLTETAIGEYVHMYSHSILSIMCKNSTESTKQERKAADIYKYKKFNQ
jgi:hypothetical protein